MNPNYLDNGYLQIFVTARADPVPDARVRVTSPQDGTVLEETATDTSGQPPFIELPAPPMEWSVVESESGRRPYAVYNVTVSAEGWQALHISGVELLPVGRSIQRAELSPAVSGGFNVRNILLPPHALWGEPPAREPEDEVKPLPDPSGLVVLPEPVIPEFVVVHDGRRVQCSGLSQWGSQALAEQGWDVMDILRKYYGSGIYLKSAEKVDGVPMSYPGSEGEAARTIQKQL